MQDNQAVVEFENKSNTTAELRKNKVLGILDLRSMGYFKVGYQKMITMAESNKYFQMHHYQQIAKSKPEAESGFYFKKTTCPAIGLRTQIHLSSCLLAFAL